MACYSNIRKQERNKLIGLEIFEIIPVIVGGSPTEPENKTVLTHQQHIEVCRYWNNVIRVLRTQQK